VQGQQRSPHEEFIMTFIIAFLLGGIGWMIWTVFHDQLTTALRWIRVGELYLVTWIHGSDYAVTVPEVLQPQVPLQWRRWLPVATIPEISNEVIRVTTWVTVPAVRPVFVAFLSLFGFWAMLFGPNTHYRRRMNLEGLIAEQAKAFPAITPIVRLNPLMDLPFRVVGSPVPKNLPLFAEALSPEEWISHNEIEIRGNQVDANATYQALAKQLGVRWQGPLKLPPHAQGLYAAFALRHARKRKESEELLGELSLCWSPESGLKIPSSLRSKITKIIKDPKLGGAIQKHADKHAYTTTALLRCLQRAREEGGVLASPMFLWLRGEDRLLWYPLNNLGRRSYHAEAVGALVHYTNELIAGQKIPTPRFEEVIKGIQDVVTGLQGRTVPPLDKTTPPFKYVKKKKK
jgi:intracellular multiplication protein IcmP